MGLTLDRKKRSNQKINTDIVSGFNSGGNTFQDQTLIKDSELTEFKNIILDIDGIAPRPGTLNYGSDDGSSIKLGGFPFYKSDGTREFLTMGGDGRLKKYVSTTPTNIGSKVYDTSANVEFVQARDKVYIFNGVDELSYYDGSTITTYTAMTTPTISSVTPQGTSGSTTYSYRVSAFNDVGETLASTAVSTTTGNATLSATNYNRVSWSSITGATGYNIWGRESTGLGETYLDTVYDATQYDDKGARSPSLTIIPPETDTSEGITCTMAIFAISRIFAAGDPDHPSRLYYSGVGTEIGNFSGSSIGGSYVDVFRNDGSQIRGIAPFQGGVIVWKDNAIYKFSFTSVTIDSDGDGIAETLQLPQLEEITRSFGGISFRGIKAVENDLVFPAQKDGRLAFYSLGNQEKYAGSVLRTNELSIKVAEKLTDVNVDRLGKTAGFYFENIYGCAVSKSGSTVNDRVWCLDTRFGSWVYWEGFNPAFFMTFQDSTGSEKLYYGTENDGYMVEMFTDDRNDNGSAISVRFDTKSYNQKKFALLKRFRNPTFQFKDVTRSGSLSGEIIIDGSISSGDFTVNQQIAGGAGTGVSMPGFTLAGEADGGVLVADSVSSDIVVETSFQNTGRSIKYSFTSNTVNLYYKFLSLQHSYQELPGKRLDDISRVYISS